MRYETSGRDCALSYFYRIEINPFPVKRKKKKKEKTRSCRENAAKKVSKQEIFRYRTISNFKSKQHKSSDRGAILCSRDHVVERQGEAGQRVHMRIFNTAVRRGGGRPIAREIGFPGEIARAHAERRLSSATLPWQFSKLTFATRACHVSNLNLEIHYRPLAR